MVSFKGLLDSLHHCLQKLTLCEPVIDDVKTRSDQKYRAGTLHIGQEPLQVPNKHTLEQCQAESQSQQYDAHTESIG